MKISTCTKRPVLVPCALEFFEYQVDPYIGCGHYCYYCSVLNRAETDWKKEILIHRDITGQLSEELNKIYPQTIFIGCYSDPYQPCEAEYSQTRKVLELFLQKGFSASLLTKSDLILRDIDLLKEMPSPSAGVSVAFSNNQTRKKFETNEIKTEQRIEVLRKLKDAGIPTYALISPVIPYITDVISLIEILIPYVDNIWIFCLEIGDGLTRHWLNVKRILKVHFPDLSEEIEKVITSTEHPYWNRLRKDLDDLQNDQQLNLTTNL